MDKGELPWRSIENNCRIFKALGHKSRTAMVYALGQQGEMCVGDLQKIAGSSLPTVSRHLAILKSAGIVSCVKKNNSILYKLELSCLSRLLDCLNDHHDGHCRCSSASDQAQPTGSRDAP